MKARLIAALAVSMMLAPSLRAADTLGQARELYASASYEEALAALTRLREAAEPTSLDVIDQYRAFCLFALGRVDDAQQVADELITRDPAVKLDPSDASPKIVAMFADARKRLLPDIVRSHYRTAKAALDRKDYAAAEPELRLVSQALAQAEALGPLDDTTATLKDIVGGFLQVVEASRAAVAPPPPKPTAPPADAANPQQAAAAQGPVIYDIASKEVTPPDPISQDVPPLPPLTAEVVHQRTRLSGLLEVVVDTQGNVERAELRTSIHPVYDQILLRAARRWKYRPAMLKDGTPVKYDKLIAISLEQ